MTQRFEMQDLALNGTFILGKWITDEARVGPGEKRDSSGHVLRGLKAAERCVIDP